jgi:hypothetical protein
VLRGRVPQVRGGEHPRPEEPPVEPRAEAALRRRAEAGVALRVEVDEAVEVLSLRPHPEPKT